MDRQIPSLLPLRDNFAIWRHVESDMLFDGGGCAEPKVTIAIPTFKRQHFVLDSVLSSLTQTDTGLTFEVIIVDNDPDSIVSNHLLENLRKDQQQCLRYFRNRSNVGIFGNWNRCIELARGEWVTVLNDDDLLDANYLALMFATLRRHPSADGIVCQKRLFDQRKGDPIPDPNKTAAQFSSRRVNLTYAFRLVARGPAFWGRAASATFYRVNHELTFRGQLSRRIRPKTLFYGSLLGNGGGFLFKKDVAIHLGGYRPDTIPAADYWFYAQFAKLYHLREHRATAASIRIAENESAKPEMVKGAFYTGYVVQHALAKEDVPRWWLRFSPLILAMHRNYHRNEWKVDLSDADVFQLTGMRLPPERPRLLNALRVLFRWY